MSKPGLYGLQKNSKPNKKSEVNPDFPFFWGFADFTRYFLQDYASYFTEGWFFARN